MATQKITLPDNNLYRNGKIVSFTDGTGEELLVREPLAVTGTTDDQFHTVRAGEKLDGIAFRYYENFAEDASKFWWVLADANQIDDPTDIAYLVGAAILIPNLNRILLLL